MEELGRRRLQGASGFSTRRKSQYLCRVWPVGVFKRNAKVTGLKSCGGCREVKIQKSKATAITTQRCATVRNRRNWTIIIKYHHLSQLKAFGNHFFFFLLLLPPINLSFCVSVLPPLIRLQTVQKQQNKSEQSINRQSLVGRGARGGCRAAKSQEYIHRWKFTWEVKGI